MSEHVLSMSVKMNAQSAEKSVMALTNRFKQQMTQMRMSANRLTKEQAQINLTTAKTAAINQKNLVVKKQELLVDERINTQKQREAVLTERIRQAEMRTAAMQARAARKPKSHGMFGHFGGMLGGLGIGFGIYEAIRKTGEFEDNLRRMGIEANMSTAEILTLKENILNAGTASGASVENIQELAKAVNSTSKDAPFLNSELSFMAKTMQATGASAEELGAAMGEIHERTGLSGRAFEEFFNTIYSAGKNKGMLNLKQILPDVGNLVKLTKSTYGPNSDMKKVSDVITMAMFTQSPSGVERSLRMMVASPRARKAFYAMGFDMAKGLPSISEIMARAERMSPNRSQRIALLSNVFSRSTADMTKLVDNSEEYKKIMSSIDTAQLMKDANAESETFSGSMARLNSIMINMSDKALGPMITEIGKALGSLNESDLKTLGETFKGLGEGVAYIASGWIDILETIKEIAGMNKNDYTPIPIHDKKSGRTYNAATGQDMPKTLIPGSFTMSQPSSGAPNVLNVNVDVHKDKTVIRMNTKTGSQMTIKNTGFGG